MKLQEIYRYAVQVVNDHGLRIAEELEDDLTSIEERYRKILLEVPEHLHAVSNNNLPEMYVRDRKRRGGKIAVKMTDGTSVPKEIYGKLADAGAGTVACMHLPEKHLDEAKKHHINVMVSDSLGINLLTGQLEDRGLEISSPAPDSYT